MDLASFARRVERRRDYGAVVRKTSAVVVAAWQSPRQRTVAFAVAAALLSALAFARIVEVYLTNDPLARWDVSFARWLAGEQNTVATDFFRAITLLGSPAVAFAVSAVVCVVLYRRSHLVEAAFLPV